VLVLLAAVFLVVALLAVLVFLAALVFLAVLVFAAAFAGVAFAVVDLLAVDFAAGFALDVGEPVELEVPPLRSVTVARSRDRSAVLSASVVAGGAVEEDWAEFA
jgi:hypothetical protein